MVIETTRPHSGWKYGNVDDQYDNDSVGSTKKRLESGKIGTKMNKQNLCATKARTASESKLNGEIGITTMAANGPSECNQISIRNKKNDSNGGYQQNTANNTKNNNSHKNSIIVSC